MTHDTTRHRRSIRLAGYDYRQAGAYFVTICTQNRESVFGDVVEGQMILNGAGQRVESVWRQLPQHYPGVDVDAFAIMPNHVHGIIILVGAGPCACPGPRACPEGAGARPDSGQPQGVVPTMSLPDVVHRFKSLTTARYRRGIHNDGWQPFPGRLSQRNYYEHVIRNEEDLNRARQHIGDNPARWEQDPENPRQRQQLGSVGQPPPSIV
jgi:REP element-mobilizing transposase RayT